MEVFGGKKERARERETRVPSSHVPFFFQVRQFFPYLPSAPPPSSYFNLTTGLILFD